MELLCRYSEVFRRPTRVYPKPATPSSSPKSNSAFANVRSAGPTRRKMLQNSSWNTYEPGPPTPLQGPKSAHMGLIPTPGSTFPCSYPQPVDKLVDNHVNYLQNEILCPRAIAL